MSYLNNLSSLAMGIRAGNVLSPNAAEGDYYWNMDNTTDSDLVSVINASHKIKKPTTDGVVQYNQTSLRRDGTGKSISYYNTSNIFHSADDTGVDTLNIPYANGFTVECTILAKNAISSSVSGDLCPILSTLSTNKTNNLWALRFDAFSSPGAQNPLHPTFVLVKRNIQYGLAGDYPAKVDASIRGSDYFRVGEVYHLLATIRPSDNTIEFWVNGVSQGTSTYPASWHFLDGVSTGSVLDGTAITKLSVGSDFHFDRMKTAGSFIDEVKIHLLEADQVFADIQYNNSFVKCPLGVIADDYNFDSFGVVAGTDLVPASSITTTAVTAEISGAASPVSRGKMYTAQGIAFGEKKYWEAKVLDFGNPQDNFYTIGLVKFSQEDPGTDVGASADTIGIIKTGTLYKDTTFTPSGAFTYAVGDVIGVAVDYTSATTLVVSFYKNNVLQQTESMTITAGIVFRPVVELGRGGSGGYATGASASIFTHADNLVYSPPSGFEALETCVPIVTVNLDVTVNIDASIFEIVPSPVENEYSWRLDDSSGNFINSGSATSSDLVATGTPVYLQPSLLKDLTGSSVKFNSSTEYGSSFLNISYQNGVTIEAIVKTDSDAKGLSFDTTAGRVGAGVYANNNSVTDSLWVLRFDNFSSSGTDNKLPTFTLLKRDTIYSTPSNYATGAVAEVRGSVPMVLGQKYHLMATIRPSNNTIEFWLDGVSLGTDTIPTSWYGTSGSSILDGTKATDLFIGTPYLNGAFKSIDATYDNVKIHLLEANQSFVDQQVQAFSGVAPSGFRAISSFAASSDSVSITTNGVLPTLTIDSAFSFSTATINWSGNKTAIGIRATNATAEFELRNDGTLYRTINSTTSFLQDWLTGSTNGSDFEVKFTQLSGPPVSTGTSLVDGTTWWNLGTNRLIGNTIPGSGAKGSTVEAIIRKTGDASSEQTATLTMEVESSVF